jgi:hypothetical protein
VLPSPTTPSHRPLSTRSMNISSAPHSHGTRCRQHENVSFGAYERLEMDSCNCESVAKKESPLITRVEAEH